MKPGARLARSPVCLPVMGLAPSAPINVSSSVNHLKSEAARQSGYGLRRPSCMTYPVLAIGYAEARPSDSIGDVLRSTENFCLPGLPGVTRHTWFPQALLTYMIYL